MEKRLSDTGFRLMALEFKIRDLLRPRKGILKEVGIRPGDSVLDYGCGPGGYITGLVELVGEKGKVYALDILPVAVKMVKDMAARKGFRNVETIQSDCKTGLPDASIDVVLLYDILHGLGEPQCVLAELSRVLKKDGILSVSDHHLEEAGIVDGVSAGGLFRLSEKKARTYSFGKT